MEKILFADTFKKTFKKSLSIPSIIIDDPVFRLHYRLTALALLFASILVSAYQFFGDPIMCIQSDDIPEALLNTYCWIEGTFTLPKALSKNVGTEIVYPGVDSHNQGDEIVEHAYYQWVCFVLFLQAMMFCAPHAIWRELEGNKVKTLMQKLAKPCLPEEDSEPCYSTLACYFRNRENEHHTYAMKFLACEVLNLINVIGQIYFIDKFLRGEFSKFGVDVVKYVNEEQQDRIDPMIRIFPRITKCTFHKYGSSGTIQKHDALCLLPLNIVNEKIFVVMWFWFVILAILDSVVLLYRIIIGISKRAQVELLKCVATLTSKPDIDAALKKLSYSYGNWFLLYLLADNIDSRHFREFILELLGKKEKKIADSKNEEPKEGEVSNNDATKVDLYPPKSRLDEVDKMGFIDPKKKHLESSTHESEV